MTVVGSVSVAVPSVTVSVAGGHGIVTYCAAAVDAAVTVRSASVCRSSYWAFVQIGVYLLRRPVLTDVLVSFGKTVPDAALSCSLVYVSEVCRKDVWTMSDIDSGGSCEVPNLVESSSVVALVRTTKGTEWAVLTSDPVSCGSEAYTYGAC